MRLYDGWVAKSPVDARSVAELVSIIRTGTRPKFVFFWGHRPGPSGQLTQTCLSQWWPTRFVAEGHEFATAEHYMMWSKASLFGDMRRAEAVLMARSPAQAKAIGRQVEGFNEDVWVEHRWRIVVTASMAKFDSNPALKEYLLGTKHRVLVEASPVDRVWGIGLSVDSDKVENPEQWCGLNLLGFALMEARHRLQEG